MTAAAGLRAALTAAVAWALVLAVFGLLSGVLDPLSQEDELLVLVLVSSFLGGALARAPAPGRPARGVPGLPAWACSSRLVTVIVLGFALTASGGSTTDAADTGLIYAAFPLGAAVGAVGYGRRWLADPR
jgi:hypothetical protein